jgi:predicted nucleic acid-binding protein
LKIVCNSSTLIALARISHLEILEKQAKNLIIPSAVYEDVVIKGAGKPGAGEVKEAKWIEKRDVGERELVMRLSAILGRGESEAIALAKEIKADLIILDDERARKEAISEGIRISGLLSLIVQAKEKGIIGRARPLMDELRQEGFFISQDLYRDAIQKIGE